MGWHCSDTAELGFADVRVPVGNLIGEENAGFLQIAEQFVVERLALAVHAYGIAARSLALTAAYCRERETFGRPLVANQVVRHRLVEMHRQVEVARTYTHAVAARHVAGESVIAEACLAKQTACDTATYVCDQAVQLHGGAGYLRGTEVERHYRDARILPIGGGATEVLTDLAAKLLGYDVMSRRREAMLDEARRAGRRERQGRRRWRRAVGRAPPRPRQAAAARADRAAARRGLGVPRAVAAGRVGLRLHRGRQRGHRHRRDRGRRVHDHRQRPVGEGRRLEPVDGQEDLPGLADRRGEPAAHGLPRRVRGRRPADAEGDLHPGREALPRPHPLLGGAGADDRAGLRQLHRRRRLRAGHERLHRDGQGAGQGLPRRPAAGQDGHRRGVGRRVARRRGDARPHLGARRLPRRGRAATRCGSVAGSWPG